MSWNRKPGKLQLPVHLPVISLALREPVLLGEARLLLADGRADAECDAAA